VTELEGFDKGTWWVQDAASAMPATLFGDVRGKTVIDLCAAPGGKTAQLAAAGAHVIAVDRSAQRMTTLHKNIERLGLAASVEPVVSDSTIWRPKEPAPFVLLDAPCSATGTIRRHPDILHFKDPSDLLRLVDVQARLLRNAAEIVAPGGVLMYCTCSLQKDEGERQVTSFLSDRTDFSVLPINSGELGGSKDIIDDRGFARILPFHWAARGGIDGFFIARLVRG
jgi:16S rRNA (cytosine967-C5)-methyltransferase